MAAAFDEDLAVALAGLARFLDLAAVELLGLLAFAVECLDDLFAASVEASLPLTHPNDPSVTAILP
jgi:hypothetical protein